MQNLTLWNGKTTPRIGVGGWAIGGPMYADGVPINYAGAEDATSLEGLALAYDLGARIFDTAAAYGGGHSEQLMGQALGNKDDVVFITKFGHMFDPETREVLPNDVTPEGVRASVERSRRHLRRDCIDLVLLHVNDCDVDEAARAFDMLQELRAQGWIDAFGWSTDFPERLETVLGRDGFIAAEYDLNVLKPARAVATMARDAGLFSISRLPLAMGLLTGKFRPGQKLASDDLRGNAIDWMEFFRDGQPDPGFLRMTEDLRDLLTTGGRSLAQGALSWILANDPKAIAVPGFRTPEQIRDNVGALEFGPLPDDVKSEADARVAAFLAGAKSA